MGDLDDKTQTQEESLSIDHELDELLVDFQDMEIDLSEETKNAIVPLIDLKDSDALEKFVQDKTQTLVVKGLEALETLMDDAQSSGDPELIESVGKFASSITSSIEILNKQVLKNKDHKTKLEVEKLKRDKTIEDGLNEVKGFVTSREEAFKAILKELQDEDEDNVKAIDVDAETISEDS
jgi:hypothetical protein